MYHTGLEKRLYVHLTLSYGINRKGHNYLMNLDLIFDSEEKENPTRDDCLLWIDDGTPHKRDHYHAASTLEIGSSFDDLIKVMENYPETK